MSLLSFASTSAKAQSNSNLLSLAMVTSQSLLRSGEFCIRAIGRFAAPRLPEATFIRFRTSVLPTNGDRPVNNAGRRDQCRTGRTRVRCFL